jgi:hypothetical protein
MPKWVTDFLNSLQSMPWWVSLSLAILGYLVAFVPFFSVLVDGWNPIVLLAAIFFSLIFVFQMVDLAGRHIFHLARRQKVFHLTEVDGACFWRHAPIGHNELGLSIRINCIVKNKSSEPLHLLKARCIRPNFGGEVVMNQVQMMVARNQSWSIPPNSTATVLANIILKVQKEWPRGDIQALIGVLNDDGIEETVKVTLKCPPEPIAAIATPLPKPEPPPPPINPIR